MHRVLTALAAKSAPSILLRLANEVLDLAIAEIVKISRAQDDRRSQGNRAVLVLDRGVAVMTPEFGHVKPSTAINFQQNPVRHASHYKHNAEVAQSRRCRE